MSMHTNELGQPIGEPVPGWQKRDRPGREPLPGRYCRIEALDPLRHARDLFDANARDTEGRMWTYMGYGPFDGPEAYLAWAAHSATSQDPLFHAILDQATGKDISEEIAKADAERRAQRNAEKAES